MNDQLAFGCQIFGVQTLVVGAYLRPLRKVRSPITQHHLKRLRRFFTALGCLAKKCWHVIALADLNIDLKKGIHLAAARQAFLQRGEYTNVVKLPYTWQQGSRTANIDYVFVSKNIPQKWLVQVQGMDALNRNDHIPLVITLQVPQARRAKPTVKVAVGPRITCKKIEDMDARNWALIFRSPPPTSPLPQTYGDVLRYVWDSLRRADLTRQATQKRHRTTPNLRKIEQACREAPASLMGTNVLQIYQAITDLLDARQHPKVITADHEVLDPQQASNALALHFKLVFGTGHRLLRSQNNVNHRIDDPEVPSVRMRDIENLTKLINTKSAPGYDGLR
jgi:hypothetical protein